MSEAAVEARRGRRRTAQEERQLEQAQRILCKCGQAGEELEELVGLGLPEQVRSHHDPEHDFQHHHGNGDPGADEPGGEAAIAPTVTTVRKDSLSTGIMTPADPTL
jgi:hypothetical protein